MTKLIHTMLRVLDLDRSIAFYHGVLGMSEVRRLDFPDHTLVYLRSPEADFEIELTLNKGRTQAYDAGDGYGHLAGCVPDLEAEHRRLAKSGHTVGDIKQLTNNGSPIGRFFFLSDPDGYRIEILQRNDIYR